MIPNRPLTHDLFKQTLEAYEVEIKEIVINNLLEGIFYARLLCVKNGLETEIDSRTSDAIALAVRYGCPIYTYEFILEHAGVVMQDDAEDEDDARKKTRDRSRSKNTLSSMNLETLQNKLNDALQAENYERAAQIRDEINRRES
jgi:bifunctional DNase/RNase